MKKGVVVAAAISVPFLVIAAREASKLLAGSGPREVEPRVDHLDLRDLHRPRTALGVGLRDLAARAAGVGQAPVRRGRRDCDARGKEEGPGRTMPELRPRADQRQRLEMPLLRGGDRRGAGARDRARNPSAVMRSGFLTVSKESCGKISTMSSAKMTSKGQITVPKRIRETLRLEPGDRIEFSASASGEVVVRAKTPRSPSSMAR